MNKSFIIVSAILVLFILMPMAMIFISYKKFMNENKKYRDKRYEEQNAKKSSKISKTKKESIKSTKSKITEQDDKRIDVRYREGKRIMKRVNSISRRNPSAIKPDTPTKRKTNKKTESGRNSKKTESGRNSKKTESNQRSKYKKST